MSKTNTTTVAVTVSGDGYSGTPVYADTQSNTAGTVPGSVTLAANTFQAVAVPATATAVTITPPPSNTGTLTLKGVTGDTGLVLGAITNSVKLAFVAGSMSTIGMLSNTAATWGLLWG